MMGNFNNSFLWENSHLWILCMQCLTYVHTLQRKYYFLPPDSQKCYLYFCTWNRNWKSFLILSTTIKYIIISSWLHSSKVSYNDTLRILCKRNGVKIRKFYYFYKAIYKEWYLVLQATKEYVGWFSCSFTLRIICFTGKIRYHFWSKELSALPHH